MTEALPDPNDPDFLRKFARRFPTDAAPQVAPEPGTEPPAMHLASVIETVAELLERSGNAKLGASLLRDGLKERKRRDQVATEPPVGYVYGPALRALKKTGSHAVLEPTRDGVNSAQMVPVYEGAPQAAKEMHGEFAKF